jgi:hypothetical protein
MEIQPIGIDYNLGAINGFDGINIFMKEHKYIISYFIKDIVFGVSYVETKDIITSNAQFLSYEKIIKKYFSYYSSYEECLEVIKNRTLKNFIEDLEKYKIENTSFPMSIKANEGQEHPYLEIWNKIKYLTSRPTEIINPPKWERT